jgi:hypothetical protein
MGTKVKAHQRNPSKCTLIHYWWHQFVGRACRGCQNILVLWQAFTNGLRKRSFATLLDRQLSHGAVPFAIDRLFVDKEITAM